MSESTKPALLERSVFYLAVASSLLGEFATHRYGAPSLLGGFSETNAFNLLKRLAEFLPLVGTVFLLFKSLYSSNGLANQNSQISIWIPYLALWSTLAFLIPSNLVGLEPWMSAAQTVGLSLYVFRHNTLRVSDVLVVSRALTVISLLLGLLFHERYFSPYLVWPGGWFQGVDRLQGLFPHPNTMGWIAAVGLAIELVCRTRFMPLFALVAVVDLGLSGSRSASIAVLVGLASYLAVIQFRKGGSRLYFYLLISSSIAVVIYANLLSTQRDITGLNGRTLNWETALRLISESPIYGLGPLAALTSEAPYVHNQVLQSTLEMGMLGSVALFTHLVALVHFWNRNGRLPEILLPIIMWVSMFLSENIFRFATLGFITQITLFQALLYAASSNKSYAYFTPKWRESAE